MNLGNVSEFAFDKKGDWLACLIDAQDKAGNGVVLRNMTTGAVQPSTAPRRSYKGLNWTEKGDGLAALRGVDDKGFEDKLYSVVAFKDFGSGPPAKSVYDPKDDKSFPEGMTISPNARRIVARGSFGGHVRHPRGEREEERRERPRRWRTRSSRRSASAPRLPEDDKPDLVIWHWKDSRLQTQQQVQENADKNFSYLSRRGVPADGKFVRLADDRVRQVNVPAESKVALGIDVREYELMGNLDGRRFEDVYVVDPTDRRAQAGAAQGALRAAARRPTARTCCSTTTASFPRTTLATGKSAEITKADSPPRSSNTENDVNVVKPPTPSLRLEQGRPARAVERRLGHLERAGGRRRRGQPDRQRQEGQDPLPRSASAWIPTRRESISTAASTSACTASGPRRAASA